MKKSAAYMINDTILLQAMSLTETGLWIAYGEVFSIRADEHEKLTTGILKSLANSIEDVAHPPQSQWKDVASHPGSSGSKDLGRTGQKGEVSRDRI